MATVSAKIRAFRLRYQGNEFLVCTYPLVSSTSLADLTPAELAVAHAMLEGLTTQEIAQRRCVSPRTVANQLSSIYQKLRISSRYELIALRTRGRPQDHGWN
jgi:DNA-binding NarL/FixJ family response regulator